MVRIDKTSACSVGGACGISVLGVLCPICIPAVSAFLASAGLGVLTNVGVLWVLVVLLSIILLLGLLFGTLRHGNILPLLLGILGSISIALGAYVLFRPIVTNLGVAAVIAATIWNLVICKKVRPAHA